MLQHPRYRQPTRLAHTTAEHCIIEAPTISRLSQIEQKFSIVDNIEVDSAPLYCLEQQFLLHTDARCKNSQMHRVTLPNPLQPAVQGRLQVVLHLTLPVLHYNPGSR